MKKKVLLITYHGGTGGVAVMLLNLAKALADDFDVEVLFAQSGGPVHDEIESLGITTTLIGIKHGWDLWGLVKLRNHLRRQTYDIVHLHYLTPLLRLGVLLSGHKNVIITEHGAIKGEKERSRWFITGPIFRILRNTVNLYTTVSEENRREMIRERVCPADRCAVIYNGIDISRFMPNGFDTLEIKRKYRLPLDKCIVGTVRGLTPKMGIDHLLQAVKRLDTRSVHCVIVGDGPLMEPLKKLCVDLDILADVSFLGAQRNIPELLSIFDIFVMPSVWETFGVAAIEAMAMKVPVVGYAVGGLTEVVEHSKTGILVDERHYGKLAESIQLLLDDSKKRREMGEAARCRVLELFDLRVAAMRYKNIYLDILK